MKEQIEEIEVLAEDILQEYTNCYSEVDKEVLAKMIYNAGYRKQEWISVEDRLPDKWQEVLAYRGDFNGDMMNTYKYLGSGNWQDDYGYRVSAEYEGITHWMPLPEPPKMKGGAE